ncbi:MAG: metallophosphoesterase [Deltaproteobacteria bacterium]|nr:MAG: metallophosphoesterase [Deltaproteobacteria bacterium]
MMKIGVISDTHLPSVTKQFKDLVNDRFADCQMVVHAGDFTSPEVYYYLNEMTSGNLIAVCGNMDPLELRNFLPEKRIFEVMGVKIGLIHGWGAPYDLEERIKGVFHADRVQCIIYGHSHNGANHKRGEILFFNPGSPTDRYYAKVNSIGYLSIQGGEIKGEIVPIAPLKI